MAAASTTQINLNWALPLDQGANVDPGSTESAGAAGNDDSQNWYRVGDVGLQVYRDSSVVSPWGAGTSLSDSSLAPNTAYIYSLEARDNNSSLRGNWHNSTGPAGSVTTSDPFPPPLASSIVASDTNANVGSNITWTAVNGFGPGKVQYYRYLFDQSATHTFTDSEPQWDAGTIATVPSATGAWYLHVRGYNGADIPNGTFDYP